MSAWRPSDEPLMNCVAVLYDSEEEGRDDKKEGSFFEEESVVEIELADYESDASDGSPKAPPYSPLSSPECRDRKALIDEAPFRPASGDRSRSPLFSSESASVHAGVVLGVFDENGIALDDNGGDDVFLQPDTHALYVSPQERDRNKRNERRVSGQRGRRRGARSVRGQEARGRGYPNLDRIGNSKWWKGHPLHEVLTGDEDVPPELVSLATDVLRRRLMSTQNAARAERNAEREDASESENDDEFFDVSNVADDLHRLEGQNLCFEWFPMDSFQGQEENFTPKRTGSVYFFDSAYDAFRSYWDDDILNLIVTETNLYATKIRSASFQSEWYPTNYHEILCLFSFWMMLGIVKMPTIASCFSADPLLKTDVFRRILTRRRYEMLNRALHFVESDPAVYNSNPFNTSARSFDRLHSLRPIITHLNSRFQSNYILGKDICIDESLTLWKGRLSFKQYIHNKASKLGIKTFELCEATTGYLWSFIVYTGKQSATDLDQSPGELKSTAVVMKLMGPLLNKGHRLFMDNWYNSPPLARLLKLNGTDCVGTLRSSRRDVPVIVTKAPLKKGQFIARHSGDVSVLSWQDNNRITMISTCHGASTALPTVSSRPLSRPVPFKPQVVLDYNKFMGGVDIKDQLLEPYAIERKRGAKWYMKLFKRLLNVSILNSRTLLQSSTQKHYEQLGFRLQLVDSILANHLSHCPPSRGQTVAINRSRLQGSVLANHLSHCPCSRGQTVSINRSTLQQTNRFVPSTHWPVPLEPTEGSTARNRNFTKRCVVCLQKGLKSQKTPYCCESCRVPLCIRDCFKLYHTSTQLI